MAPISKFRERAAAIAARFVQTIVVIDDQAYDYLQRTESGKVQKLDRSVTPSGGMAAVRRYGPAIDVFWSGDTLATDSSPAAAEKASVFSFAGAREHPIAVIKRRREVSVRTAGQFLKALIGRPVQMQTGAVGICARQEDVAGGRDRRL